MEAKKKLYILTGPTAVGKTALSVDFAKSINGEIISADSMQVYKYMDIGTAKVTKDEMKGVKHYLIDEFYPNDEFNVFIFQEYAKKYIEEIYKKGKLPILVGGTGFYIQSVLYDIDFTKEEGSKKVREKLEELAREKGNIYLHDMLKEIDQESAQVIHANNVKRVIRAIEYYKTTGEKMSKHNKEQQQKKSPYDFRYFVLNDKREDLYNRIDKRIDIMVKNGLVKEVENLLNKGYNRELVSMQGLGYKEIVAYLKGECTLEEAIYILKRDTRHFAKRQLTWFRREKDVIWVDKDKFEYDDKKIIDFMVSR